MSYYNFPWSLIIASFLPSFPQFPPPLPSKRYLNRASIETTSRRSNNAPSGNQNRTPPLGRRTRRRRAERLCVLTIQFYDAVSVPEGVLGHTFVGTEIRHVHALYRQSHHYPVLVLVLVYRRLVFIIWKLIDRGEDGKPHKGLVRISNSSVLPGEMILFLKDQ